MDYRKVYRESITPEVDHTMDEDFMQDEARDFIERAGGDFDEFSYYYRETYPEVELLDGNDKKRFDRFLQHAYEAADATADRAAGEGNRKHYEDEGFYEWDE